MNVRNSLRSHIRGWFPQEPTLNAHFTIKTPLLTRAEFNRKIFKASLIANAIMLNIFLGINFFLIQPHYASLEVTALQWSIYIPIVLAVNALIYRHYKRRLLSVGDN